MAILPHKWKLNDTSSRKAQKKKEARVFPTYSDRPCRRWWDRHRRNEAWHRRRRPGRYGPTRHSSATSRSTLCISRANRYRCSLWLTVYRTSPPGSTWLSWHWLGVIRGDFWLWILIWGRWDWVRHCVWSLPLLGFGRWRVVKETWISFLK